MNKKQVTPILFSLLSNIIIYSITVDYSLKDKSKFSLRKNLTTMQIPVRSYYKWDLNDLRQGEKGEVLTKEGEVLIPNVYVYTTKSPSSEKTLIVTIQTNSSVPIKINKNLKNDDFFILSKKSPIRVTRENKIEELFF